MDCRLKPGATLSGAYWPGARSPPLDFARGAVSDSRRAEPKARSRYAYAFFRAAEETVDAMKRVARISTVLMLRVASAFPRADTRSAGQPSTGARSDAVVPFKIHVPDSVLRDLRARLARARFPDEIEGQGWEHGVSLAYMKDLVAY